MTGVFDKFLKKLNKDIKERNKKKSKEEIIHKKPIIKSKSNDKTKSNK